MSLRRVIVAAVSAVLLLDAAPAAAQTFTTSLVAPYDQTTMGDGQGALWLRVTNTGATNITGVQLDYNLFSGQNFAQSITPPPGWTVNYLDAFRNSISFTVTTSPGILPGANLVFVIQIQGDFDGPVPQAANDVTDNFNAGLTVTFAAGPPVVVPGGVPGGWTRRALKVTPMVSPTSLPAGVANPFGVLSVLVENRSNDATAKNLSIRTATIVGNNGGTATLGALPAPVSVTQNQSTILETTYSLAAAQSFHVDVQAWSGTTASTSAVESSDEVNVGQFTDALRILQESSAPSGLVDVELSAYNNSAISLGGVRPAANPTSTGTAVLTYVSGPFPASVPNLAPGAGATFRYTYQVAAAAAALSSYQLSGDVIANGYAATNTALSNSGIVYRVGVNLAPDSITNGDPGPVRFNIDNGTGVTIDGAILVTFPAGWVIAAAGAQPALAGYTITVQQLGGVNRQVTYTPTGGVGTGTFTTGTSRSPSVLFTTVPAPPGTKDVAHRIQVRLNDNGGTPASYFGETLLTSTAAKVIFQNASPLAGAADGFTRTTLTVKLEAVATPGTGINGRRIWFETSAGTLSAQSAVTAGGGFASVVLTAPAAAAPTVINGTVTASHYTAVDTLALQFTGPATGNLVYLGGTLFPRSVQPNTSVAFTLYVTNTGAAPLTLPAPGGATQLQFDAPGCTFSTTLGGTTTINQGVTAQLTFPLALIPAACTTPATATRLQFLYNPTQDLGETLTISATPTFAAVSGLAVAPAAGGARVTWSTDLEIDNLGFRVLRADGAGEPEEVGWVDASGASFSDYAFLDVGLDGGFHAWWIEDVAFDGVSTRHGPVFLDDGVTNPAPALVAVAADRAAFGVPTGSGVRILEDDADGITLEITPPPHEITTVPWPVQMRDVVTIDGWDLLDQPGLPRLPVRALEIPIPARARGEIVSITVEESVTGSLDPAVGFGEGSGLDPFVATEPPTEDVWPPAAATLVTTGHSGATRIQRLLVTPVRWERLAGMARTATRIVVRVRFVAETPVALESASVAELEQRRILSGSSIHVRATGAGIVRIPLAEIESAGIPAASAGVFRRGVLVASTILGADLLFVADAQDSPWSITSSWWIAPRTGAANVMTTLAAPAPQGTISSAGRKARIEENVTFAMQSGQSLDGDRFYWTQVLTGGAQTASAVFTLDTVDAAAGAGIRVNLKGMYDDTTATDEHRVALTLNGVDLGAVVIDARDVSAAWFALAPGTLVAGANTLEIRNDSSFVTHVALDSLEVEWTAPADAAGTPGIAVVSLDAGPLTAGGLPDAGVIAVDETDPAAPRLLQTAVEPDGAQWRASVAPGAAGRVIRFTTSLAPSRATWSARDAGHPLAHGAAGADYVVIAAPSLVAASEPFADRRAAEGMRTAVIDLADVEAIVSFGDADPNAVPRFLAQAAAEWPLPSPRYVLLAGDSAADPRDHLGMGIPEALLLSARLETGILDVPADARLGTLDGDLLPDLAIGRIPARTPAELADSFARMIAYEDAPRDGWDRREAILADDDLPEFANVASELAALVPDGMDATVTDAATLGTTASTGALRDSFTGGSALVTYVGHGGVRTLGTEPFLDLDDVATLGNERLPVVLAVDCLNGYFDHPATESLGEGFLRGPGGAVAFVGSSAITRDAGHLELARAFHQAFWREPGLRLGDVVRRTQAAVSWREDAGELVGSMVLFGDPALKLNVNGTPFGRARLVSVGVLSAAISGDLSTDPDADPLGHRWEIVSAPAGAQAALVGADSRDAELSSSIPGRYRLRLFVSDSHREAPGDDLVVELRAANGSGTSAGGCRIEGTARRPSLSLLALAAGIVVVSLRKRRLSR